MVSQLALDLTVLLHKSELIYIRCVAAVIYVCC